MKKNLLGASLFLGLTACTVGSAPPENFYTLSAQISDNPAGAPTSLSGVRIEVVLTHLDELVDRPQWVVRIAPNQVAILEQQRWAEALKIQIPQVIAENLQRNLPQARISATAGLSAADARVVLDVQKFETGSDRTELSVAWKIMDGKRRVLKQAETRIALPVTPEPAETKYAAAARTQSKGLSRVSVEIANALRLLSQPLTPASF